KNQRKSLAAQQEMFTMGMTSLVEVITTQESLSAIEMDLVEAKTGYANAVAQMRYATGTLIPTSVNGRYEFDTSTLMQMPDPGEFIEPTRPEVPVAER
ncbi:MAG: TolC family protein, partial [Puniceicoccales bacterium]